jgi:hypothetical protein
MLSDAVLALILSASIDDASPQAVTASAGASLPLPVIDDAGRMASIIVDTLLQLYAETTLAEDGKSVTVVSGSTTATIDLSGGIRTKLDVECKDASMRSKIRGALGMVRSALKPL